MILATTAGKVGSETVRLLRQRDVPVRWLVRDAAKAKVLAEVGAEGAVRDLQASPASRNQEIPGAQDRGGGEPGQAPAGRAAERDLEAPSALESAMIKATSKASADSPIARRRWQAEIEAGLAASAIPHTLLRSNAYMQNVLMLAPAITATSSFGSAAWKRPHREWVDARDVAAVAAEIAISPAAQAGRI